MNSYDSPLITKDFEDRVDNHPGVDPEKLYDDHVPQSIQDCPEATLDFMDGNEKLGVEPRDVSHGVSTHNGGPTSDDNTYLEKRSSNRRAGEEDMTEERHAQMIEDNEADARILDEHYTCDDTGTCGLSPDDLEEGSHNISEIVTIGTAGSVLTAAGAEPVALEIAGELIADAALPVIAGALAAKQVISNCKTTKDKVGYGSLAAGATVAFMCTPLGQACGLAYIGLRVGKSVIKAVRARR